MRKNPPASPTVVPTEAGSAEPRASGVPANGPTPSHVLLALFEGTAVGITVADVGGRILHANSATVSMLGYSLPELRGLSLRDLTHPDDWPASSARLVELLNGRAKALQIEKRWRRNGGGFAWVRNTVS